MSLTLCFLLLTPLGQLTIGEADPMASKASLERIVEDISGFEIAVAGKVPLKLSLIKEPVLRWNYPIRNVDDAALFVWMGPDRPEAIATVMSYHDGADNPRRAYEFLSVSQDSLDAVQKGERVWRTDKSGFTWTALPKAPVPARTAVARRRQMNDLAAKFRVAVRSEKNRYELRLLSQPLYRYQNEKGDILDGCLFAFVEGTDPEMILALESSAKQPGWKFATGRLTRFQIDVLIGDEMVAGFPEMTGAGELADVYRIPEGGPLSQIKKSVR